MTRPANLPILIGAAAVAALIAALVVMGVRTRPVRQSVIAFTELLAAANVQDLSRSRGSARAHLAEHPPVPAPEGGIVGLPRNVHPNFQAWPGPPRLALPHQPRRPDLSIRPRRGAWKFDGPIGLLRGRGQIILDPELTHPEDAE